MIDKKPYDPARRNIKLTAKEGKRFKHLGNIGEFLAEKLLKSNGFSNIVNLNRIKNNFPFADFRAEKDGTGFLISVKTRNKYENNGRPNARIKLGKKVYAHINELNNDPEYKGLVPAWMIILMEENTFDAYFGTIPQLNGKRGISTSKKARDSYLELAYKEKHNFNSEEFKNTYDLKSKERG
jgi:hypothetical protein